MLSVGVFLISSSHPPPLYSPQTFHSRHPSVQRPRVSPVVGVLKVGTPSLAQLEFNHQPYTFTPTAQAPYTLRRLASDELRGSQPGAEVIPGLLVCPPGFAFSPPFPPYLMFH